MCINNKTTPIKIQSATINDCFEVAILHVKTWQHAYRGMLPECYLNSLSVSDREIMWRRMIKQQSAQLLVARIAEQITGFVAFGASRDKDASIDRSEIWAIYVAPESWSMGIGHSLWVSAQQEIIAKGYTSASLWLLADNEKALRFYERVGFTLEPSSRKSFELGGVEVEEIRCIRPRLI
ncbi:GNAT family N-acetyltransferase [Cobetia amphilecti]|uniref:GNAT family N-acetyltransferase n=2 Tax=Cobetia TaxID=204286 RepID=UPI0026E3514C|nr:GNAT family N-acetyltransferase [Cobetia amphilecti]MDO6814487.1 GNAT family N-acetyltransferase [Cobetia amphilecti]